MFNNKRIKAPEASMHILADDFLGLNLMLQRFEQNVAKSKSKQPVNGFSKVKSKISTIKTKRKYTKKSPYWRNDLVNKANKAKR